MHDFDFISIARQGGGAAIMAHASFLSGVAFALQHTNWCVLARWLSIRRQKPIDSGSTLPRQGTNATKNVSL
jgi:hypothetical protein